MVNYNEIAKQVLLDIHNKSYEDRISVVEKALIAAKKAEK